MRCDSSDGQVNIGQAVERPGANERSKGNDLIHAEAWGCGCAREEKNAHIEPFAR